MADAVQASQERQGTGQGRSQFSLRGLFVLVTLCALASVAVARVPSPGPLLLGPPLVILAFLITIQPRTTAGAALGSVLGVTVASSRPENIGFALLVGNWGALLGATAFTICIALDRVADRAGKDEHQQE